MWKGICQRLSDALGSDFTHCNPLPVHQDSHCRAFKLDNHQQQVFIKLAQATYWPHFASEQVALQQLAQAQHCAVPVPLYAEKYRDHSLLAMPFLSFQAGSETQWYQLGQQLAQLHQCHQNDYGWQEDNFIGPTPQPNRWQPHWDLFFSEQRIGYQLQLLAERGIKPGNIDEIIAGARHLLAGHQPPASLLHGDLWHGNVGFTENCPWLFDPASYYGDRETDLAMSELFGSFPGAFYQGYQQQWPLPGGYGQRKPLYQLYHLLNHTLLFGDSYLAPAQAIIAEIVAQNK